MPPRSSELLEQVQAGKCCWQAPAETKDALVRFQRDVVLPLRRLAAAKGFRLREHAEMYRGARFVVRVEIVVQAHNEAGADRVPK